MLWVDNSTVPSCHLFNHFLMPLDWSSYCYLIFDGIKGDANCELPAVMNPSVVFAKPVSKLISHDLEEASGIMCLLGAAIHKGQMFLPTPSVGRPYTFVEYHRLRTQRRLWWHQLHSDVDGEWLLDMARHNEDGISLRLSVGCKKRVCLNAVSLESVRHQKALKQVQR